MIYKIYKENDIINQYMEADNVTEVANNFCENYGIDIEVFNYFFKVKEISISDAIVDLNYYASQYTDILNKYADLAKSDLITNIQNNNYEY